MRVIISNSAGLPIYTQIKNQIKDAVLTGEFKEGDALPSIRKLAAELRVSVITTTKAYSELEDEGFISAVQGKGYFVTLNKERIREEYLYKIEHQLLEAIEFAKAAGITREELLETMSFLMREEDL
ncbi:GntR family transcriptional regulator [Paenibacillus caui]|uniref:GntR family transcriptional regulator n=1 Tax=Paenibacillus caui TaxID=2873927 RepID=UPI001CA9DC8E|nr:GntR family transcriptional regulator [Paenibacillus caui]